MCAHVDTSSRAVDTRRLSVRVTYEQVQLCTFLYKQVWMRIHAVEVDI